jgi:hypothetical protein
MWNGPGLVSQNGIGADVMEKPANRCGGLFGN